MCEYRYDANLNWQSFSVSEETVRLKERDVRDHEESSASFIDNVSCL